MEREEQTIVREWHGSGEIRFARQWLATVTYTIFQRSTAEAGAELSEAQECGPEHAPKQAPQHVSSAWGSIIVVNGERYLPVGATCELRLKNGRNCLVALQAPARPGAGKFPVKVLQPETLQGM